MNKDELVRSVPTAAGKRHLVLLTDQGYAKACDGHKVARWMIREVRAYLISCKHCRRYL